MNKINILPNQQYLKECFTYLLDGTLKWNVRPIHHFKSTRGMNIWNARFPNMIAGCIDSKGYLGVTIDGKLYRSHRIIWKYHNGFDNLTEIDHIDNDRLNNRIENLREANRYQNNYNVKKHKDNSTGFKGVSYFKSTDKYRAQIKFQKKYFHLGYYNTPEQAYDAYCAASIKHHKEFSNIDSDE
jgi:hypothetical protein